MPAPDRLLRFPLALALLAAGTLILAGCGAFGWSENDDAPRSTFEVTFSEPLDTTLTGDAFVGETAIGSGQSSGGAIGLLTQGGSDRSSVVIDNPATNDLPSVGTYDLARADSADNAGFDAFVASFSFLPSQDIGGSFSGTLDVTDRGSNSASGSFEFEAFVLYSESERVDTVNVSGSFQAVAADGSFPPIATPSP